ncbi:alanyl-tRNA synthetase [Trypanosoma grayi]|uniref:alanyl-tRNA synthetase n=1 Tax=Trypanosoma grayi TaxID=71804 RepID=UPI0004F410D7|nr:alanyl-tRNA synthetase [Trypanosoma grayi]KEG11613.1 alanyl-tRNA synthetase [Trypanosoma grayi]
MVSPATVVRVGELACQRNPFLRELRARIVSCEPALAKKVAGAKKSDKHAEPQSIYDVVLSDSVLFPEGGGQPCDHGLLIRGCSSNGSEAAGVEEEEIPVRSVQRRGDTCVIASPRPLPVGEEVLVRVDWARRLDHMQHHSAQHLLSAVLENPAYGGLPTMSWSLTHPYCYIVLPTGTKIAADVMARIEEVCNDAITRAVPVRCDVYPSKEAYQQVLKEEQEKEVAGEKARASRAIPADVMGPIRIISLEDGIDRCTCCGTHVTNLAQLQVVKLLHQETKGDTLKLFFVAGDRVRRYFGDMYLREKELMKEMGGVRPEDFVAAAVRKGKDFVDMEKRLKNLTLELVKLESEKLIATAKADASGSGVVVFRRDDVDVEFFNALRDALRQACPDCVGVFAWGSSASPEAAKSGQFMIVGPAERVEAVAPTVCAALEGRGGMSKFGYRGKGSLAAWERLAETLHR